MNIPFVDLKTQYQEIKEEVLAEISEALDGMQLFLGKNVQALEAEFAEYCGTDYAIGVGSGTDALHISLRAAGIGPGDEVITVANTFIATVEAIIMAGAKPVFVDIDADTYNMDVTQLESKINSNTKAILPVHLYGQPADMDPILELAEQYKLRVIEDACQAHGAEYKGKRAGSLGNAGCFSFYFSKNLGGYGEGGIITTSDPKINEISRMLRDHGSSQKYHHSMMGMNGRLDEIQAAILRIKLRNLDKWSDSRRRHAAYYNENLPTELLTPREMTWAKHVYHLYVVRSEKRGQLQEMLSGKGIGVGMHYPIPIHQQEAWKQYGGETYSLPVTEKLVGEILSLPMYPEMTSEQADYVCSSIREFCDSGKQVMV